MILSGADTALIVISNSMTSFIQPQFNEINSIMNYREPNVLRFFGALQVLQ